MTRPAGAAQTNPPMIVVHDALQPCPYLADQTARMPLNWPLTKLGQVEFDLLLQAGYRRSGVFLYRTQCPSCSECHPTRVPVAEFRWSSGFRRTLKRGDAALRLQRHGPICDHRRVQLFNLHNQGRGLDIRRQGPADEDEYRSFLVDSCCETEEWSYWLDETLVAVAIVDYGTTSLSAVYCYYDPAYSKLSLGTYSILKQLQYAAEQGRTYVYLGLYVADNQHLNYKARFLPQERLIDGHWVSP